MSHTKHFYSHLDDLSLRADWGMELTTEAERKEVAVPRIETLVAGFSNRCHLRCSFCYEDLFERSLLSPQNLDVHRLISLVNDHKITGGENIEYFRIGNTGEPLINKDLETLLLGTQDAVNWFSVISSLSVKNERLLSLVESHPKINMVHASCDASDSTNYAKIRKNGDFNLVWKNIQRFKRAGKYVVLNAVALQQNGSSLVELPRRMADFGVDELHIFYPINTSSELSSRHLAKMTIESFADLYSDIRDRCTKHNIILRTDPWCYHPDLIGIIEDIDTPELFEAYQRHPCDWQWMLILHPDGCFQHCTVQKNIGTGMPVGKRPFDNATSLYDLVNSPESLAFRRLHLDGRFPSICQKLCHKQSTLRPEHITRALFSLKYETDKTNLSSIQLARTLREQDRKIIVRAFSPALRRAVDRDEELAERISLVIDKNLKVTTQFPVVSPNNNHVFDRRDVLLLGSNRSSIFYQAADLVNEFDQIYKVVIGGSQSGEVAFRRLK